MMHSTVARTGTERLLRGVPLFAVALLGGVGLLPGHSHAQSFALPVDLEQGLVFGADQPRTPYLFGMRLTPSLDLERARFGLVLGPAYRNPGWDFALGGRMSWFVPMSAPDLGVRFAVQGEYLPRLQAARASIGVLGELFGLLRIGVWPAYDFEAMRPELCVALGFDVVRWAELLQDDL